MCVDVMQLFTSCSLALCEQQHSIIDKMRVNLDTAYFCWLIELHLLNLRRSSANECYNLLHHVLFIRHEASIVWHA